MIEFIFKIFISLVINSAETREEKKRMETPQADYYLEGVEHL